MPSNTLEQVIDHPRLRTMLLNLQIQRGVHIHGHGFDSAQRQKPPEMRHNSQKSAAGHGMMNVVQAACEGAEC